MEVTNYMQSIFRELSDLFFPPLLSRFCTPYPIFQFWIMKQEMERSGGKGDEPLTI